MTESGAKQKDFSVKIYSMCMNEEIILMKNVGRMALFQIRRLTFQKINPTANSRWI